MTPLFAQILRSRWFAVTTHVGLWVLIVLAALRFGGKAPGLRDSVPLSSPATSPVPVAKLERLFAPNIWPVVLPDTNSVTMFFTKHFIPPTPVAPPPPTTRKVEITYLGYFEVAGSPRTVQVKLADAFLAKPVGGHISTNWLVSLASMNSMTLTNNKGETTLLPLNVKKEIEVPIQ